MKKLLTIFITLILTLFIAQQSFATSTEEEDEANAAAGEMVRIVNYDDLDSDTRNILYDGVKRDDRSNEEHLAFLKSHLYQVDKNGHS